MAQSTPISELPPPFAEEDPERLPFMQQIMDEIHSEDQRVTPQTQMPQQQQSQQQEHIAK